MSNKTERLSRNLAQRQLHRFTLLPIPEVLEKQITLQVPTANGGKRQEVVFTSPLFDLEEQEVTTLSLLALEQRDKGQLDPRNQLWKLETISYKIDDDRELQKQATLPTIIPKGIASQQDQLASVMQAEISGAASNAAIVGFGSIIGYLFKYGNNLVIQRTLGAKFFGLYTVCFSIVTLVASIFDLGLDNAMIRYIAIYRSKQQSNLMRGLTIFCSAMVGVTGILGAFLVLYFAPYLAMLIHKPDTAVLLQIMSPLVPLLCMQTVWIGGLQGLKEFKRRVLVQRFLVPLMMFLLIAGALIFFRNVTGVAVATFLGTLLSTLISLYFLFRTVSRTRGVGSEVYELRKWLGFALPNFMTTIVSTVLDSVDTLLLAFFVPALAIGQYAAAIKISGFILLPMVSLNIVFTPTIAELHAKGEKQKLEAMFKIVTKWSIILCLPIFLFATLFSVPVLELSGNSFVAGWPLLIALALGNLVNAGTGAVGYMLLMTGHQKFSFFNSIAAVILNVVLGLILTARYGAMGTAISTALAIVLVNLMRLLEVRLLLEMHPYRWDMLKPLGAGIISALLTGVMLYGLSHAHLFIQLALAPVFFAIYFGLLALFKISPEDKIVLNKLSTKFGYGKKVRSGMSRKGAI